MSQDETEYAGEETSEAQLSRAEAIAARILARDEADFSEAHDRVDALPGTIDIASLGLTGSSHEDWQDRRSVGRSAHLAASTELLDIQEVEYRQVRLERVVVVGLRTDGTAADAENSLRELAALAQTAGATVTAAMLQRRDKPDPATYLGKGKAQELREVVQETESDTVVVDGDLAPSQRRALEDAVGVKVIDRTAVILDIFAQHAKSREGKAQVELAQLEYLLPRLRGWGESMSRQAGGRVAGGEGIGSRGPGETKIELDRRRIRTRMAKLRQQIKKMEPGRVTRRLSRRRGEVPAVAIAGYTNAGKSTLLNALTGADVMAADALFATLDPTVRRVETEDGREYTVTDTVGFVRSLPTQLVEAFRSTLEEIGEADLVLHVVDASHPDPESQVEAVRDVLSGIEGFDSGKELVVLNKTDLASATERARLRALYPDALEVSAQTGSGLEALRHEVARRLPRPEVEIDLLVPFKNAGLVSRAPDVGEVDEEDWTDLGVRLKGRVPKDLAARLREVGV